MTQDMQNFLRELAALLEKHGVEIEALEETQNWETYCAGIEFTAWSKYDAEGQPIRETCQVATSRTPDARELLALANA